MLYTLSKKNAAWAGAALILLLGWLFSPEQPAENSKSVPVTAAVNAPVLNKVTDNLDAFEEYRLEREKMRTRQLEFIRENETGEKSAQYEQKMLQCMVRRQWELESETMLKVKGYKDVLVFFHDSGANVVVKAQELTHEQVVQISAVVNRLSGIEFKNIAISTAAENLS